MSLSRRAFLGGAVAGAAVWTVPQIVSLTPAYADAHSEAPKPKPRETSPVESAPMGPALPATTAAQLPFTGDSEKNEALAGGALLVAGAVTAALAHEQRRLT